jgi:hypothetical protein
MKITAELIQHSPQFTNPLSERQLDLRGYKITAVENMGATLVPPSHSELLLMHRPLRQRDQEAGQFLGT